MILIAISLFLSSFLLFLIQPLIGKYILPWFGSSPAVWSASLLFFQVLLTGGYAYAYAITGKLEPRRQALVHWVILGFSVLILFFGALFWESPLLPGPAWRPDDVTLPFWDVIKVLLVAVGVPYFLLATNSTLLQAWFNQLYPGHSPYRLYALSNFASLLGLLSYPFVFEPLLKLTDQARLWAAGYGLYFLSACFVAWRFMHSSSVIPQSVLAAAAGRQMVDTASKPKWYSRMLWLLLPAIASLLLLAVTNQITQEVAVIPFLWILPLTLYLLSFILTFESDRWYGRGRFTLVLLLALGAFAITVTKGVLVDIRIQITAYCLLFFVCCMICHGELARLRPAPKYLTSFYLTVSVGGALGGLFVNLAAPFLFVYYWELHLGFGFCFVLLLGLTLFFSKGQGKKATIMMFIAQEVAIAVLILLAIANVNYIRGNSLWLARNFYGVLRVKQFLLGEEQIPANELMHGITLHGLQFTEPEKRKMPTSYYWKGSGIGQTFRYFPLRPEGMKIGVIGLGVGTLAAYGREGDTIRFYEINPYVVRLAQGENGYFTFLKDSAADIEIIVGDARLSLENELEQSGSQNYDLLVVDAFSSDSIPVHLLTLQAFELYWQHLKPDGVLAVHVSNRILDLEKVVSGISRELGLQLIPIGAGSEGTGTHASGWEILTNNEDFLGEMARRGHPVMTEIEGSQIRLWTDDYSNLYQILR